MSASASRETRWAALYEKLAEALQPFGVNDALGNGDFWIVDDDWGGQHQKIHITKPGVWCDALRTSIQGLLRGSFSDWGVYVVFEEGAGDTQRQLIVYEDGEASQPRWD